MLPKDVITLLQGLLLEVDLRLLLNLVSDETDHILVIRHLLLQHLDLVLPTRLVEVQTHTPELVKDVIQRVILGDDTLVVEGVHVRRANLLCQ